MKAITLSAICSGFRTRKDKSLGFSVSTPELSTQEKVALMDLDGINVRLLIEPSDYEIKGKVEVKGELARKSQSERLRAVLFCLWKHLCETNQLKDVSYEAFYHAEMDKMIEAIKAALPAAIF